MVNIVPKENKDLRHIKNWQPISLLNASYELYSKVVSNKIMYGVEQSQEQNTSIKVCSINSNIRTTTDFIDYSSKTKTTGILLLLD